MHCRQSKIKHDDIMLPRKVRFTNKVMKLVAKARLLFPKKMVRMADYVLRDPNHHDEYESMDDRVQTASLLDEATKWLGVNFVTEITSADIERIRAWSTRNDNGSGRGSSLRPNDDIFTTGLYRLGVISFQSGYPLALATIEFESKLPKFCFVDLLRLNNGVTFLSVFVSFGEEASARISNLDVSRFSRYKTPLSLNPFSKHFYIAEHYSRLHQIEKYVADVAKDVVSEAKSALDAMFDVWGMKSKSTSVASAAVFSRDSEDPFFSGYPDHESSHRCIFEHYGHLASNPTGKKQEEYIRTSPITEDIGVDGVFIHSEKCAGMDPDDLWENSEPSATDGYTGLLYVTHLQKLMTRCSREIGRSLVSDSVKSKKTLKFLAGQSLELNRLDIHIEALRLSGYWFDSTCWKQIGPSVDLLAERAETLRHKIETRKVLLDYELQLDNIYWMRKYSWVVGFLVVIQIVVATATVDWSEKNIDKNTMYINYQAFKKGVSELLE